MQMKTSPPPRVPPVERIAGDMPVMNGHVSNGVQEAREPRESREHREHRVESSRSHNRGDGAQSPSSPVPPSGKYSLMQYAMQNFRQSSE